MTRLIEVLFIILCYLTFAPSVWAGIENYYGTATITSPASLGTIDLALTLDTNNSTIQHDTSYIMLDKTLLFPAVAQLSGKSIGPRLTGTASAMAFSLTTDTFTSTVSGKAVTRKVTLDNATVTNGGSSIAGTYTETISGLTPEVITTTGSFILVKPTVPTAAAAINDLNGDGWLDLSEITAGGKDPNAIEFSDVSYALHLYNNPLPNLKVGSPSDPTGQQTIKDALAAFSLGLKSR